MGRYLVSFKVNWSSFPVDEFERAKIIEQIQDNTSKAMDKGILVYWGISLDLTHGYAIWNVGADEMAKIAVLRMPYLEPVDIRELLSPDEFIHITKEVAKVKKI